MEIPYNKAEAYRIADRLEISFDNLPCAVIFDAETQKPQKIVSLGNDLTSTFRTLFARFQSKSIPLLDRYIRRREARQPVPETTPDVSPICFLSHNHKDKTVVREVASTLHSFGIETWFDEWEILPGDRILKKIEDGLSKASAVVVFLSRYSVASRWVEEELHNALYQSLVTNKPRIIPVMLEDCSTPLLLSNYRRIEVGSSPPAIASEIRSAVLGLSSKPPVRR
jgi:hypothetical protein